MSRTICALATPPGTAGLAVIRISGNDAFAICDKVYSGKSSIIDYMPNSINFGRIIFNDAIIDEVTVAKFAAPRSYTGEDVIEISCHGGVNVYNQIIDALLETGCSPAEPGEFTRRAFLNGKMDLARVEAVADLIHSESTAGAQTAARQLEGRFSEKLSNIRAELSKIAGLLELELDFAEEDIDLIDQRNIAHKIESVQNVINDLAGSHKSAEILRHGFYVGLAGFPNSGKSTLFNALLERKRAIVSHIAGTTRDYLEEALHIEGIPVKITDTAGLRNTTDAVEVEGVLMVESVLQRSDLILVINDSSLGWYHSDELTSQLELLYPHAEVALVQNKIDKIDTFDEMAPLTISAKFGEGIKELKRYIYERAMTNTSLSMDSLVNRRQANLLLKASEALDGALDAIDAGRENELIALEIRSAISTFGEITGEKWSEEVLNTIFGQFCIGK